VVVVVVMLVVVAVLIVVVRFVVVVVVRFAVVVVGCVVDAPVSHMQTCPACSACSVASGLGCVLKYACP